ITARAIRMQSADHGRPLVSRRSAPFAPRRPRDAMSEPQENAMPFDSIFRPGLFAGATHVVTGAGSGIGRCTAHELASLGATVVLVGRKPEKLERVRDEIAGAGGTAHAIPCDIREEAQVQAMVAAVLERTGRVDGLVNNAGGQFAAPLASITGKGWETVVRTNLTGGFLCARECYTRW